MQLFPRLVPDALVRAPINSLNYLDLSWFSKATILFTIVNRNRFNAERDRYLCEPTCRFFSYFFHFVTGRQFICAEIWGFNGSVRVHTEQNHQRRTDCGQFPRDHGSERVCRSPIRVCNLQVIHCSFSLPQQGEIANGGSNCRRLHISSLITSESIPKINDGILPRKIFHVLGTMGSKWRDPIDL